MAPHRLFAITGVLLAAAAGAIVSRQAGAPAPPQVLAASGEAGAQPGDTANAAGEEPLANRHSVLIRRGTDGHFHARVYINDYPVDMLVDTGATSIVLTPEDARRAGLPASTLEPDVMVSTAAGRVPAALARLKSVRIDRVTVEELDAIIMPEGLETSLLGMNFLNSLSRFEVSERGLILTR